MLCSYHAARRRYFKEAQILPYLAFQQANAETDARRRSYFSKANNRVLERLANAAEGRREKDVLYVDGIYLGRKACILICCDEQYVLGWYLCRKEHSGAWEALLSRIAEPCVVVSDGGSGFARALKNV